MAKVKVTNLKRVSTRIRKAITKAARDKVVREAVGEAAVDGIKSSSFGTPAPSTVDWRKRYEKTNETDKSYKRNKINITFTGELLNDLANNVKVSTTGGAIRYIIEHSKKLHKKYNGVKKKIGKRVPYKTISKGVQGHGYEYLTFTKKTKDKILKAFKKAIFNKLK